jgi:hypothetical protein
MPDDSTDPSPALDAYALSYLASEFGLSIDQVRYLVEEYGTDVNVLGRAIRDHRRKPSKRRLLWAASTLSRH